ncbi:RagB/SusD domain-containing protein [Gemmatirosa kalamazoonensis]|uniref:RagB/SusD domain-containing protein n=1 Tax=Gemmatirosa kalamazoonensis TaxID=861299 RepID=W0RH68_9BACT|nr:RagB/SusD family nutrient uptake outer membrane protein [Gemmatirosa kalamazoonensis]AHG89757.1 RagB/SusD domain-containing protein [Gemmatirosa kalamazoonensis]
MLRYITARRLLPLAALAFAGCTSTGEILSVTDPDIINPTDVQSAAGANAVRLGALARLNVATSGGESLFLLGGLFADEWLNGDSFIARQEIDQRVVTSENNFLRDANYALHRARVGAIQAVDLLKQFAPTAPGWQPAEMYFVQAYTEVLLAEHLCSGIVFSDVVHGEDNYGSPMSTTDALNRALAHADSGLRLVTGTTADDNRVKYALQVTKGRILLDLGQYAAAAAAVTGVPTNFQYVMRHSQATNDNQFWAFNNNARRYTLGNGDGGGINFAAAADPRLPSCVGGDAACRAIGVTSATRDDLGRPITVQMLWTTRDASVAIVSGVEARLIEAEAQLQGNNASGALATLNALRAPTGAGSGGVAGLQPLTDAGSAAARVDQLFRERALWLFGTGHRTGDLRRLIRQYGRPATVFPTGTWQAGLGVKSGNYGTDVTLPIPQAEQNNPNVAGKSACLDRNA